MAIKTQSTAFGLVTLESRVHYNEDWRIDSKPVPRFAAEAAMRGEDPWQAQPSCCYCREGVPHAAYLCPFAEAVELGWLKPQ